MKDLVLLVADKNAHFALKGALGRPEALGIRPIEFEFRVHPGRDGGTRRTGPEVLALERRRFKHALLVLDFEGCGTELPNATALEAQLDGRLSTHWKESAKSIVIEPELDVWVWGADNAVEPVMACGQERARVATRARFYVRGQRKPNPAFGRLTPLQVIELGEIDRLWSMVHDLGSGQPE
jgi:hypothetical protein